ncbi:MAG: SIMPL domain-containing protein [Candidatus Handelsmanbacteria bacterium]|nr:SIMPL domain-containing protein [Candidatus Handelsmanbacteria bacterium]
MKNQYVFPALLLGLGLVAAAAVVTRTWRENQQTISVVGSAKKEIVSDLGFLRGALSAEAGSAGAAFQELERQKPALLAYLAGKGFPADLVRFFPIAQNAIAEYDQHGRDTGRVLKYTSYQRFEIQSPEVRLIEVISLELASLVERGVSVAVEPPEYFYSRLPEIKVEIQALAAQDAMTRAQKIAAAADCELGVMRTARMGVLQITPRYSNVVADYGVNDATSIDKEITAVVQATFAIAQ